MKRGPKRYEDRTNGNGVVPTRVIAQWTGLSVRGVEYALARAIRKLKAKPGAFEVLLDYVHACAAAEVPPIHAYSAECNLNFRTKFIKH
jgi:hypothetical protein